MRSTFPRLLLVAVLMAAAAAHAAQALSARISIRQQPDGSIAATLRGLLDPCTFGFTGEDVVRVESTRILVVSTTAAMGCPAVLLPFPHRPIQVSVSIPPLAGGAWFVSWVDGFGGSPVGHGFDLLRSFDVAGGTVITPIGHLMRDFYRGFLGREADAGGAAYWAGVAETFVERGFTDLDLALLLSRAFVASGELEAAALTDPQFVRSMYVGYLGREPDVAGLAYWTAFLAAGRPRAWLASVFMHSAEFSSLVAAIGDPSPPTRPEVQLIGDVLRATQGRPPDDAEYVAWLHTFRSIPCQVVGKRDLVAAAAEGFVNSYFDRMGAATHGEYVVALYDALLRGAADPAGFDYWTALLDTGAATRERVRAAFQQSAQFQAHIDAMTRADCAAPS